MKNVEKHSPQLLEGQPGRRSNNESWNIFEVSYNETIRFKWIGGMFKGDMIDYCHKIQAEISNFPQLLFSFDISSLHGLTSMNNNWKVNHMLTREHELIQTMK